MRRVALMLAAAIAFASTANAQATRTSNATQSHQPGAILPGTYDLQITFGGGTMDGTLAIAMVGDSLDAKLSLGSDHAPPIKSIVRKGSHLTLSGTGDGIDIVYEIDFSGDALVGKFTFNGDNGTLTGKRRK